MNIFRFQGFDWDGGNFEKCQKHGVSIEEIEDLFSHEPLIGPDPNIETEERYRAIGQISSGRYVFVVFTTRLIAQKYLIRPISARYMHTKEVSHYEKIRQS